MAHFEKHYYEIRAGMLRRHSFAPMSQTVKVQQVFVHEQYDRRGSIIYCLFKRFLIILLCTFSHCRYEK